MRILFLGALLLLSLSSCIKELNKEIETLPPKVVVNSLFCPDSTMLVHVSLSGSMKSDLQTVYNAELWLYENDFLVEHTTTMDGYYYRFNHVPQAGKNYYLEVKVPEFEMVSARSSVPHLSTITKVTNKLHYNSQAYSNGTQKSSLLIAFNDDPFTQNFYELKFKFISFYGPYETLGDSYDYLQDPSILADTDLESNFSTYYFSDELFNGEEKEIRLSNIGDIQYDTTTYEPVVTPLYLIFRDLSPEFYKFRKTWGKHLSNQTLDGASMDVIDFFYLGDPVTMYSNVKGGLGIFAGYNVQLKEVEHVE